MIIEIRERTVEDNPVLAVLDTLYWSHVIYLINEELSKGKTLLIKRIDDL